MTLGELYVESFGKITRTIKFETNEFERRAAIFDCVIIDEFRGKKCRKE